MIEPMMQWLYCSECKWTDDGPNVYKGTKCPNCGDLLVILEGSIKHILKIYDEIKFNNLSLQDYLEENINRNIPKQEKYII